MHTVGISPARSIDPPPGGRRLRAAIGRHPEIAIGARGVGLKHQDSIFQADFFLSKSSGVNSWGEGVSYSRMCGRTFAARSDAPVNFGDDFDWIPILLNLAAALLYRLLVHPWLEPLIRVVRSACVKTYQRLRPRDGTASLSISGARPSLGASVSPPSDWVFFE
jgi:hypothetical protein